MDPGTRSSIETHKITVRKPPGRSALLPRRQRTVLVLRYYEHLTDIEIADELGCSSVTVRGYASRALAGLRLTAAASDLATTAAKEIR